jgi:protease-4
MGRRAGVLLLALALYVVVAGLFLVTVSGLVGSREAGLGFGPRVAVVEIEGLIVDAEEVLRDLKGHRESPLVRAVVVRINSPGGVVAPTQEIYQAVRRLREAGKPVVASLGAVAASGGYYIAAAANEVYASPGTLTGSIGVIMQLPNAESLMKKIGVEWVVVKAGAFKDLGNLGRAMTAEERRVLQALLDDVHGQFIAAVADGRKLERAEVVRFADGRVFSGTQALGLKMIDKLGGLDDAVDAAARLANLPLPPRVVPPRRRFSLFDLVRNQVGLPLPSALAPGLPLFKTPLYLME